MLCCSCWNCQPWVASKFLKTKWNAQICSSASQAIFKGPRSLLWLVAATLDGTCRELAIHTGNSFPDQMVSSGGLCLQGILGHVC